MKKKYLIIFCLFFPYVSYSMYEDSATSLAFNPSDFMPTYNGPEFYEPSRVRSAGQLNLNEIAYVFDRKQRVTNNGIIRFLQKYRYNTSKILEQKLRLPNIAIAGSGGGYRAMICFLGFMIAAHQTGLLDTTLYWAGVSGSTWLMGPIMARNISPLALKPILKHNVRSHLLDPLHLNLLSIANKLYQRWQELGSIEPADLWGSIIADKLMGDLGSDVAQNISFASIRSVLNSPTSNVWPFPIFNSIISPHEEKDKEEYRLMEFNPYSVSSRFLRGRIDAQEFEGKFDSGVCRRLYREISLGSLMGIFGSAYSLSLGDILMQLVGFIGDPEFKKYIQELIRRYHLFEGRILPSSFNNFVYNMPNIPGRFGQLPKVTLEDAGIDLNLPTNSLLNPLRGLNFLIICGASSDASKKGYPEICNAAENARKENIPFPDVRKPRRISEHMIVFDKRVNKNISVPTVIYLINPNNFSTFKLEYSSDEFETLCGGMESIVLRHSGDIAHEIFNSIKGLKKSNNKGCLSALLSGLTIS